VEVSEEGLERFFSVMTRQDGSNVDLCRRGVVELGGSIVAPASPRSQIVPEILGRPTELDHELLLAGELQRVGDDEYIMYKPRWGAFYQTALHDRLVDTVALVGCNFPNCPRTTLYEASERDLRIVLIADAVSGIYDRGVEELRRIGAHVTTASSWSERLAAKTRSADRSAHTVARSKRWPSSLTAPAASARRNPSGRGFG